MWLIQVVDILTMLTGFLVIMEWLGILLWMEQKAYRQIRMVVMDNCRQPTRGCPLAWELGGDEQLMAVKMQQFFNVA
jgi:hypothetical protein